MQFLFLINIFHFTPPFFLPHSWHTEKRVLPLRTHCLYRGCSEVSPVTGRCGVVPWLLIFSSHWYFCSPLFCIFTSYNYNFSSFSATLWLYFNATVLRQANTVLAPPVLPVLYLTDGIRRPCNIGGCRGVWSVVGESGRGDDKDSTADISLMRHEGAKLRISLSPPSVHLLLNSVILTLMLHHQPHCNTYPFLTTLTKIIISCESGEEV